MRSAPIQRIGLTVATISLLALATACGGNASGSDGGGGSSGSKISVSKTDVKDDLTPPKDLPVTAPLAKPAPTGLHIVFVGHEYQQSVDQLTGLEEAAKVLGWSVKDLTYDLSNPATLQTSVESAISLKPDAIVIVGAVSEQYAAFLSKAQAAGIPLIAAYTPGKGQQGMYPILRPEVEYPYLAGRLTDVLAADAAAKGDTPHIVQLWNPPAAIFHNPGNQGVKDELAKVCPACTVHLLGIELADMTSGAFTQQVVSYLQSHPDVKYVIADSGQLANGLYPALSAAGLNDVTIYGIAGTEVQTKELAAGAKGAWTVQSFRLGGWIAADEIARVITGDKTDLWDNEHLGYIINSDNAGDIEDPTNPVIVADYQDEFKKMWGK